MIRKFLFATAAIAALGTASLAVSATPAAAWSKGNHHHHSHFRGLGFYVGGPYESAEECVQYVLVATPVGPRRRLVNVCGE